MLGRQAGTFQLECLCKQACTHVCLTLQHRISGLMSAITLLIWQMAQKSLEPHSGPHSNLEPDRIQIPV